MTELIPRYVRDRDALARRCGLSVSRAIQEDGEERRTRKRWIVSRWRGSIEELRATGLFGNWRPTPKRKAFWSSSMYGGVDIEIQDRTVMATWSDEAPVTLLRFEHVEATICSYFLAGDGNDIPDSYHETLKVYGSAEELITTQFVPIVWLPKKARKTTHWRNGIQCVICPQVNGSYLCSFSRRISERPERNQTREYVRALVGLAIRERDAASTRFMCGIHDLIKGTLTLRDGAYGEPGGDTSDELEDDDE